MKPHTIISDNREAIVSGSSVQISRLQPRNRKKPLRITAWPETDVGDQITAWNIAFKWTEHGAIDDELTRH